MTLEGLEPRLMLSTYHVGDDTPLDPDAVVHAYTNLAPNDWRGSAATAGGMVLGYWDGRGYPNFVSGGADTQNADVNNMIATSQHYNDYSLPDDSGGGPVQGDESEPGGTPHPDNCLADFMQTSWSAHNLHWCETDVNLVDNGMAGYAHYMGYSGATAHNEAWNSISISFADYKAEIDANRPVVLYIDSDGDGVRDLFVTGTGYNDDSPTSPVYYYYNTLDGAEHSDDFDKVTNGVTGGIFYMTFFNPGPLPGDADWTVLVYMAADNNLEDAGIDDFLEMAQVGSNEDVRIVIQLDTYNGADNPYGSWSDTRRGEVQLNDKPDDLWGDSRGELNMGASATLTEFVNWAMGAYSADHYALIMWDHGGGSLDGCCWDDHSGGDNLEMDEVRQSLETIAVNFDVIAFDACLMGMVEVAHEIMDYSNIMVASEETVPWDGFPYNTFLADLNAHTTWTGEELAESIVNRYDESYATTEVYTISAIDNNALNDLSVRVSALASDIIANANFWDYMQLQELRDDSPYYPYYEWDPADMYYRDLGTFLDNIANADPVELTPSIINYAQLALDTYDDVVLYNEWAAPDPLFYPDYPLGPGGANGTGISIYFQQPGDAPNPYYDAANLVFADETLWDEFLVWWENGPASDLEIHGMVWEDLDGDGALNGAEVGIAGWRVFLDANNNDVFDPGEDNFLTNPDGSYDFLALSPDEYSVVLELQTDWMITFPTDFSLYYEWDTVALTGYLPEVVLRAGNMDGDADIDLVALNKHDNTVLVMKNNGSGVFGAPTAY